MPDLTERKIHPPPPISTPREAPWTDISTIIAEIRNLSLKVNLLVDTLLVGFGPHPPPAPPGEGGVGGAGGAGGPGGSLAVFFPLLQRDAWDHDHVYVPTPGTAVQMPSLAIPPGFDLVVRALPSNTDNVYIGKTKAFASLATKRITLAAGEAVKLRIRDTSLIFVDAAVANEGIEYFSEI